MRTPLKLAHDLEELLAATNDGLRACMAGDSEALHRALDERERLLQSCQKLVTSAERGTSTDELGPLLVAISRLSRDLDHAAMRLRDAVSAELTAATRAQTAVGDYLAAGHPSRQLDRTL
jgi:hypothetical protein